MDEGGGVAATRAGERAVLLASDRSAPLTGRLISAVHDDWRRLQPQMEAITNSEAWTLRRVLWEGR